VDLVLKAHIKKKVRDAADKAFPQKMEMSWVDGAGMYNHACHLNAVNAVRDGRACAVVECVVLDDAYATAHYINLDSRGKYIDLTLGYFWAGADYRFVRLVPMTEWGSISDKLNELKARLCKPVKSAMWSWYSNNELC